MGGIRRAESLVAERAYTLESVEPALERWSEPETVIADAQPLSAREPLSAPTVFERPGASDIKLAQRWDASLNAPERGPIHIDRTKFGDRIINRANRLFITRIDRPAQAIAYVLSKGHEHLAVFESSGAIKIYATASAKKEAEVPGTAIPVHARAFVPGLAALASSLAIAQTHLACSPTAFTVGALVGAGLLLKSVHSWAVDRMRQKEIVRRAVVTQTYAFASDGRSFDRVVPGGVRRLNLSTGYDSFFRRSEAKPLKSLAGPVRAAL